MSYFRSFVKLPLPILFWLLVFIGFHINFNQLFSTWSNVGKIAWPLVSFMGGLAVIWTFWYGLLQKNVNSSSVVVTGLLAVCVVYTLPQINYYEYTGFNEHFWRFTVVVGTLFFGIILWLKNKIPVLNKMMLIGAIGILFLQCLHSWIFWMSYESRQELIINEYHWILTNPSQSERMEECKKREYDCYFFPKGTDISIVKFGVTDFNRGTVEYAQKFIDRALAQKKPGFEYWSWMQEWWRIPSREWPAVIGVQTNENGDHLLLVDGRGVLPIISSHANFFAFLAALGTLVWGVGSLMVVFFHIYAWKRKAKRKLVDANAKNN